MRRGTTPTVTVQVDADISALNIHLAFRSMWGPTIGEPFRNEHGQLIVKSGEDLTVENIQALYQTVGTAYGFDSWAWDSRDYVCITHFFTSPMYVISYVVSNDAALQLYQMEKAERGTGLACYTQNLNTMEAYFLAFLESAGLKSPFTPGRLEEVRQTLEVVLG